jgi:hypothetical protein
MAAGRDPDQQRGEAKPPRRGGGSATRRGEADAARPSRGGRIYTGVVPGIPGHGIRSAGGRSAINGG